jgi:hypothetical protein
LIYVHLLSNPRLITIFSFTYLSLSKRILDYLLFFFFFFFFFVCFYICSMVEFFVLYNTNLSSDQIEELFSCSWTASKHAQHTTCNSRTARFLYKKKKDESVKAVTKEPFFQFPVLPEHL